MCACVLESTWNVWKAHETFEKHLPFLCIQEHQLIFFFPYSREGQDGQNKAREGDVGRALLRSMLPWKQQILSRDNQPTLAAAAAAKLLQSCVTPQTVAHQAPPSLGFSRQEHWSGLPFPSPMHESEKWKWSCSVVSDSSRPHGLQPTRLLCPWEFPGESTGVGCHWLLQAYPREEPKCYSGGSHTREINLLFRITALVISLSNSVVNVSHQNCDSLWFFS